MMASFNSLTFKCVKKRHLVVRGYDYFPQIKVRFSLSKVVYRFNTLGL